MQKMLMQPMIDRLGNIVLEQQGIVTKYEF